MSGTTSIRIRAIRPEDLEHLVALYAGLSADARYARFLRATGGITEQDAARFCGPDHEHGAGLVAEVRGGPEDGRLVGHLCLEPAGTQAHELAVAVADDHLREGIGRRLVAAAVEWAAEHRVRHLHATMLATNAAILGLIRSAGLPLVVGDAHAGVVNADIDVAGAIPLAA